LTLVFKYVTNVRTSVHCLRVWC